MRREFLIGLFFLVAIGLFIGGILYLKGKDPFGREEVLKALFADARGIESGAYVYLKGVKVGEVKRVQITGDGVMVEFSLRKGIFLPADSKVEAKSSGFFEEKILALIPGSEAVPVKRGMVLKGVKGENILEILERIEVEEFLETLKDFRTFAAQGGEMMEELRRTLKDLSVRLGKIETEASPKIGEISQELEKLNASLSDLSQGLKGGALGKLISDTLFSTRLSQTLLRLDSLIQKLQKEMVVRVKLF